MTHMADLSERISRNTALVENWLACQDAKEPSFEWDAEAEFPDTTGHGEIKTARIELVDDTKALHDLLIGPGELLRRVCLGVSEKLYSHLEVH